MVVIYPFYEQVNFYICVCVCVCVFVLPWLDVYSHPFIFACICLCFRLACLGILDNCCQ